MSSEATFISVMVALGVVVALILIAKERRQKQREREAVERMKASAYETSRPRYYDFEPVKRAQAKKEAHASNYGSGYPDPVYYGTQDSNSFWDSSSSSSDCGSSDSGGSSDGGGSCDGGGGGE